MKWIGGVFTFSFILFMSSWFAQSAIANGSMDFVVKMAETKSAQSLKSSGTASTPLPSQLIIPKLHIKAFIKGMGLTNQGEMSVPDNGHDVAWFKLGARPGEEGNAVIAGHVDDQKGPAIFYHLDKLTKGDEIFVTDQQGQQLVFVVTNKASYPRDSAPIREIFGPTFQHQLNLITCTGTFDHKQKTHERRLVIYTSLRPEKTADVSH
ncbi:class F sortase [Priestia aryabhattai]|uniref:class F sortase n=1 Tax=Priestia TaxID=2800373 RepID=UPI00398F30BB